MHSISHFSKSSETPKWFLDSTLKCFEARTNGSAFFQAKKFLNKYFWHNLLNEKVITDAKFKAYPKVILPCATSIQLVKERLRADVPHNAALLGPDSHLLSWVNGQ